MSGLVLGARMALEQYPGYKLACRLRDGEGIEEILAGKLRAFANWLSPPSGTNRGLEQIEKHLDVPVKSTDKIEASAPQAIAKTQVSQLSQPGRPARTRPEVERVHSPSKLVSLRYTGEKKGEMRILIKATGKWIEFSALAPNLNLEKKEADWLLAHSRDFIRR